MVRQQILPRRAMIHQPAPFTVSQGQTLKYPVTNNLDPAKGEIEMKFQLPSQYEFEVYGVDHYGNPVENIFLLK